MAATNSTERWIKIFHQMRSEYSDNIKKSSTNIRYGSSVTINEWTQPGNREKTKMKLSR